MTDEWSSLVERSDIKPTESFDSIANRQPVSTTDLALRSLQAEDLIIAFIAGFAGSLSSYALTDTFNKVHGYSDSNNKGALEWYGKAGEQKDHPVLHQLSKLLRHPSSAMDKLPGAAKYGGLNHRLKYGHDFFNPFEVWGKLTNQYGGNFKASIEWVRHLTADTFSKEGLPIPGHSLFRSTISEQLGRDWTKYMTVKARDVTGAALVSAILTGHDGYLKFVKKIDTKNTYARYQRNIAAYSTCLISGLMLGSLNYAALVLLAKNSIQLIAIDNKISRNIDDSLETIRKNIESPARFGIPFVEMIADPSGQIFYPEDYKDFVGNVPANDNILILK